MEKEKELSELIALANELGKNEDVIKMLKGKLFDVKLEKFLKNESSKETAVELTPDSSMRVKHDCKANTDKDRSDAIAKAASMVAKAHELFQLNDGEFKEYPLDPRYSVSKDGRVKSPKGTLLVERMDHGRRAVRIISKDHRNVVGTSIAVMVAKTYGLLQPDQTLRHLEFVDGDANNCHLDNLRVKTSPVKTEPKSEKPQPQEQVETSSASNAEGFVVYPRNPKYMVNREGTVIDAYGKEISSRIVQDRVVVSLVNSVDMSHSTVTVASMVARTFGLITEEQSMRDVEYIDGDKTNVKLDNLRLRDANATCIAEPEPEVIEEEESAPVKVQMNESLKSGRNSIPLSEIGTVFSTAPKKEPANCWQFKKRHEDGNVEYMAFARFDSGVEKFSEQPATPYRIKKWWTAYKDHKQGIKENDAWVHIYEGVYVRRS
jgi:hypothetical protein